MSGVMWNALMAMPNPGLAVTEGVNQGLERGLQLGMQKRRLDMEERKFSAEEQAEVREYFGRLALAAETPQQAREMGKYLLQQNIPGLNRQTIQDFMNMPDEQWPAVRAHLVARAGLDMPGPEKAQLVPFTEGGGVARYDARTGKLETLVAPNPGNMVPGSPVQGSPPAEAIARLRSNPHEAAQFDEIFGPGAAERVLGGSGGNAGGNFRDPLAPL